MSHPENDVLPLGLTVHTSPSMQALAEHVQTVEQQRRGRWKMLLVLLVCAAPVIASYFSYYVWRPEGRRNFGELIEPQQPMPQDLLVLPRVQPGVPVSAMPLSRLQGQWLLISTSGAACDDVCASNLYLQRQLRESLGKEKDRVDTVWLVNDGQPVTPVFPERLEHIHAHVLQVEVTALRQWLWPADGQSLHAHIYVVDPMGNWMMRFPAHMTAEQATQAKKDMERLLRASASWDRPGRIPAQR